MTTRQWLSDKPEKLEQKDGSGGEDDSAAPIENGGDAAEKSSKLPTRPDNPVHKECESLFSSGSGFHNYRGLLNDCIILLVLSNSRNIINNLLKYGFLVNPLQFGSRAMALHWSVGLIFLVSYAFPLIPLVTEKMAAKGSLSNRVLLQFYCCYFAFMLLMPATYTFFFNPGPTYSFFAMGWYTILWMKLVSYVQVNWWCRNSQLKDSNNDMLVKYPDNLHIKDMVYFMVAPTLCYELNFPRRERRRFIFIVRRLLEVIFILNAQLAIVQQWMVPTALNSLQPFDDMQWAKMVERVLLLALPNHLFWLLGFYLLFHSLMNLVGELIKFGDRRFYEDWWNAQNIKVFWKTWNIPVHRWASRHLYYPLISIGFSKFVAQLAVFGLSAFFHEYLVSFPLQMIRPWAFVGMICQIPLGILTSMPFARGQIGNVMVWTSILLGQPIAILMYLHDYYLINWSSNTTPNADTILG